MNEDVWYKRDLHRLLEKKFSLQSGKIIRIVRPLEKVAEIRIKRVPSWWKEDELRRIFSFYGSIRDIYQEKFRNTIDPKNTYNRNIKDIYTGLKNGNWKIKMIVRTAIPSTLVVSN